jgi:hypothetical protein
MHQPIEDGIRERGVSDLLVPAGDGHLRNPEWKDSTIHCYGDIQEPGWNDGYHRPYEPGHVDLGKHHGCDHREYGTREGGWNRHIVNHGSA